MRRHLIYGRERPQVLGGTALTERLRVLIADRLATRRGIRLALGDEVEVCGEADSVEQAIRLAKREQPALGLVAADLGGDPLRAVRGIHRASPGTAVVLLGNEMDVELFLDSARAGAVGYLPGGCNADQLRRVVRAVAANEAVVPRSMVLELMLELRGASGAGDGLTGREAQVLGLLRRGRSTAEIAQRLGIAPVTVRRHISELVHKLGVDGRAALMPSRSGSAA